MPTYVYRFVDTGETIEVQQAFTDAALTEAPHPETQRLVPVRKVFTPVGVTFKGGGFYKTDSRSSNGSSRSSSASPSPTTSTTPSADTSSGSSNGSSESSSGNGSASKTPAASSSSTSG